MNYAVVAIGAVILIVAACWVFWGRHRFVGPVKTTTVVDDKADM